MTSKKKINIEKGSFEEPSQWQNHFRHFPRYYSTIQFPVLHIAQVLTHSTPYHFSGFTRANRVPTLTATLHTHSFVYSNTMSRLQKKDLFTGKLLATAIRTAIALLLLHEIPWPSSRFLVANAYSIGDVDPRALRGVWRLTSLDEDGLPFERRQNKMFPSPTEVITDPKMIWKLRGFLPMKEFTTYPKKIKSLEEKNDGEAVKAPRQNTEIFIKLKDDFTFEQCSSLRFSDGDAGEDESFEEQLALEVSKRERESFAWKGTWDFVDGKLILAADRPEKKPFSAVNDDSDEKSSDGDTILVGRVSVQENESLTDNPVMEQREMMSDPTLSGQSQAEGEESSNNSNQKTPASQPARSSRSIDVHLSVPKGKIKTGKFMYPKHHPSFFEQPIVRPQHMGSFELRQILGDYNAKLTNDDDDDELVELFRKKDLVGKRFYLSTFPIPKYKRKGRESWSTKEQKWIHDVFETAQEKQEEAAKPGNNMQVSLLVE